MNLKENRKNSKRKSKRKVNWIGIIAMAVIVVFVFGYVLSGMPIWEGKAKVNHLGTKAPSFELEATLQFFDKDNQIVSLYVEIADDAYSREKGLMFRYHIPDTVGMLFIFPEEHQRFFWMKNTPSSLDIIYANKEFEIVSIHENTPPYSHKTIPSGDVAKYVIELKAGSSARFNLQKGNSFKYELIQ